VGLGVPPIPSDLTNVIAVAAGEHHCLAVRTDGTVAAWGSLQNHAEQPPVGLSNVVAVAAGSTASLALKRDGTVVGWGPKSAPPVDLFGVTAIAAGRDQFLAAKADGTVVSWGLIPSPPPVGASNFLALAAGPGLSAGVLSDGRAVAWGAAFGTPINYVYSSNALGVAVRSFSSFFVLHNNGTVEGINTTVPAGLSNVVAVSANSAGSLALRGDGTVFGWDTPVSIALTNIGVVAGGSGFGLLLTTNPPPPVLAGTASPGTFLLSTPISVPGYILESTTGFSLPYAPVDAYTNSGTNTLALPSSSPIRLFRLRKL
jgi:alpha-tubulin suppressor-like RCC1 family protein